MPAIARCGPPLPRRAPGGGRAGAVRRRLRRHAGRRRRRAAARARASAPSARTPRRSPPATSTSRSCSPTRSSARWPRRAAGIAERWGYRRDFRGRLLTRAVRRPAPGARADRGHGLPAAHHSAYYLRLTSQPGHAAVDAPARRSQVPAGAAARARGAARRAPASRPAATRSSASRRAPPTARRSAGRRARVAEASPASSAAAARAVLRRCAGRSRNRPRAIQSALAAAARLAGPSISSAAPTWRTLMGVLARCRVVVANDSGRHARGLGRRAAGGRDLRADRRAGDGADRAGTRIVRHDVWCRPCLLRECPIDHRCLAGRRPAADAWCGRGRVARGERQPETARDDRRVPRSRRDDHRRRRLSRSRRAASPFYPWTIDAMRLLKRRGFAVVVVTNQSGVARGLFPRAVHEVHAHLTEALAPRRRRRRRLLLLPALAQAGSSRLPARLRLPQAEARHGHAAAARPRPRRGAVVRRRRSLERRRTRRAPSARAACWSAPGVGGARQRRPVDGRSPMPIVPHLARGGELDSPRAHDEPRVPPPPPEVPTSATPARAHRRFARGRVAVVGDLIADEFIYGRVARVSREAPVLILEYDRTEVVPGGAGNAANNVAALGAKTRAVGVRRPTTRPAAGCVAALPPRVDGRGLPASAAARRRPRRASSPAACTRPSSRWCASIAAPAPRHRRRAARASQRRALRRDRRRSTRVLVSDYGAGLVTPRLVAGDQARGARRGPADGRRSSSIRATTWRAIAASPRARRTNPKSRRCSATRSATISRALERAGRALLERDADGSRADHARQPRHGALRAGRADAPHPDLRLRRDRRRDRRGRHGHRDDDARACRRRVVVRSGAARQLRRRHRRDEARHRHRQRRASWRAAARRAAPAGAESRIVDRGRRSLAVGRATIRARRRARGSPSPTAASTCCTSATCATSQARRPRPIGWSWRSTTTTRCAALKGAGRPILAGRGARRARRAPCAASTTWSSSRARRRAAARRRCSPTSTARAPTTPSRPCPSAPSSQAYGGRTAIVGDPKDHSTRDLLAGASAAAP